MPLSSAGKKTIEFIKLYAMIFAFFLAFGLVYLITNIMFLNVCAAIFWLIGALLVCVILVIASPLIWKRIYPWFKKRDEAFANNVLSKPGVHQRKELIHTANMPHFIIFIILFFVIMPASAVGIQALIWLNNLTLTIIGTLILVPLVILGIAAPALAWISFIYSRDKLDPEPEWALLLAFGWGMFSTFPSFFMNTFNGTLLGLFNAAFLSAIISAPLWEEIFKAFGFFLLAKEVDNELDGLIYGICFGVGFATVENFLYAGTALADGGSLGFMVNSMIRGVFTVFLHIIGPALVGFFLGRAVRRKDTGLTKWLPIMGGLAVGIINHGIWNIFNTIFTICCSLGFILVWSGILLGLIIALIRIAVKHDKEMYGPKPVPMGRPPPPPDRR